MTARDTARALSAMRWDLARNTLRSILVESRLRILVIAACSVFFWISLFIFFLKGFEFLQGFQEYAGSIIEYALSLYFLSIVFMLFFSVGIITYNGAFLSKEAEFLLTLPMGADRVFAFKFGETMAFACWGFFLIGSPLLIAFGVTSKAPPLYYVMFLAHLFAFILVPGGLGAAVAILVGFFLPRRHKTVLVVGILALLIVGGVLAAQLLRTPGEAFTQDWLSSVFNKLAFTQDPLWPNLWISRGLVASAEGNQGTALFYLWVTAAHGGMAYLVAAGLARLLYRPAFSRVQGGRSSRAMRGFYQLDETFHRVVPFISRPVRLLILKDFRILRRDPAQWSQFLILLGLLGFYFLTIRRLGHDAQSPSWRNLLSFLNLAVTALLLSTFTSRFVYPLLSLEGRNFWILGLFPVARSSILWGKFAFASGISLMATVGMVILGDLMLRVGPVMVAIHVIMIAILCCGLAGISVGLGARFPNLRETDPSKIAAGFGGTLNLLLSLLFILLVVMAVALPCHLYFASRDVSLTGPAIWRDASFQWRVGPGLVVCGLIGLAATIVPMRVGLRAFRDLEL